MRVRVRVCVCVCACVCVYILRQIGLYLDSSHTHARALARAHARTHTHTLAGIHVSKRWAADMEIQIQNYMEELSDFGDASDPSSPPSSTPASPNERRSNSLSVPSPTRRAFDSSGVLRHKHPRSPLHQTLTHIHTYKKGQRGCLLLKARTRPMLTHASSPTTLPPLAHESCACTCLKH